jgi:hypothetical protein
VRRLATAVFGQFERLPALSYVTAEQNKLPVLKGVVEQERAGRLALAAAALGEAEASAAVRTLAALLDHGAYQALKDLGLTADQAAQRIAEVANAWLDSRRESA